MGVFVIQTWEFCAEYYAMKAAELGDDPFSLVFRCEDSVTDAAYNFDKSENS